MLPDADLEDGNKGVYSGSVSPVSNHGDNTLSYLISEHPDDAFCAAVLTDKSATFKF